MCSFLHAIASITKLYSRLIDKFTFPAFHAGLFSLHAQDNYSYPDPELCNLVLRFSNIQNKYSYPQNFPEQREDVL